MKKVFIISLYEGTEKNLHRFHFRGFYQGIKIRKILVRGGNFEKNQAYVLALCQMKIQGDVLYGECVKFKKLFS